MMRRGEDFWRTTVERQGAITSTYFRTFIGMPSACSRLCPENRETDFASYQHVHVHISLLSPLSIGNISKPGSHQHERKVAIGEITDYPCPAAYLTYDPFHGIIGSGACAYPGSNLPPSALGACFPLRAARASLRRSEAGHHTSSSSDRRSVQLCPSA